MSGADIRKKLHTIIFEADTPAGKTFDVTLIIIIVFSVVLVVLESVRSYRLAWGQFFYYTEWCLTGLFISEYFLRIYCVEKPWKYIFSFFGIIDFFASFATPLGLIIPGAQSLLVVRSLRLLRVFRILKLPRYFSEGMILVEALKASRIKISVFLFSVVLIVLVAGTTLYLIEGPKAGFSNIPISVYWAIVTLTTVGYGDIAPETGLGRMVASGLMIVGYAIIAVPTGIVTTELTNVYRLSSAIACPDCGVKRHSQDAKFCRLCGGELN